MWGAALAWLTTFAFKPVLEELAREVGKDWVKDFFKGWPGRIFKRLLQIILPTARDKAIKGFKQLVKKELEADGLDKYQVKQYTRPLSQFLKKESVREILDSAFQKDCKTIDAIALARIWEESNLKDLPSNFNWDVVATPYYREVLKIRRDSAELRAILDSENLETIALHTRTTAQVLQAIAGTIPEFDLEQYRESLHKCYGYLELYVLDSTDQQYRLRLEDMFIPQMVREGLPPSHYDLPKEIQQRLRETGQVEAEFSLEDLERYRESYLQMPARPVLEVLADDDYPHVVILGDPGSGKSTLLQYLALRWVKEPTERLPLLVELGDYTCDRAKPLSFLDFFHLNRDDLNRQLQSGQALVLFNGLDEVFDSVRQKEIITEIIGFTIKYKNARVIVTSRSVGYNLEQLRNAEFRYLTLQDLEPKQIHEFIGKWHELALGNHSNREISQRRLEDAITNSKAIAELAGNPLLLTLMAILNRYRELPNNRVKLYNQASQVLLYDWEVKKDPSSSSKLLKHRDKQVMLRQIAYEMQAEEKSIKGNTISREKLLEIITSFLNKWEFDQPRQTAQILIDQLRKRNFLLCLLGYDYLGNDYYGFVHRTFLEYFCAWEFVNRFETHILTEEQLKTEVFEQHWQDESWHEVLRLICGMVGEQVAGAMIGFLMEQKDESGKFTHLFLATECLSEVRNRCNIKETSAKLLNELMDLAEWEGLQRYQQQFFTSNSTDEDFLLDDIFEAFAAYFSLRIKIIRTIAQYYSDHSETLLWLKFWVYRDKDSSVRQVAVEVIAQYYEDDPTTLSWLQSCAEETEDSYVRWKAVEAILQHYRDNVETLPWFKYRAYEAEDSAARLQAVAAIVEYYQDEPETLPWLKSFAQQVEDVLIRKKTVAVIAQYYKTDSETLSWLKARIQEDESVQWEAVGAIAGCYGRDPETLLWLKSQTQENERWLVRQAAVAAIAQYCWFDPEILPWLKFHPHKDEGVRRQVVQSIAEYYRHRDPEILTWLKSRAQEDESDWVRQTAVREIAEHYWQDSETLPWLKSRIQEDEGVRSEAVAALAQYYRDDPETLPLLKIYAQEDKNSLVPEEAVAALGKYWSYEPGMYELLYNCAINDPFEREEDWQTNPRQTALEAILEHHQDNPQTLKLLLDRAENDPDEQLRELAKQELQKSR